MSTYIIALGGSLVAPDEVDIDFLYDFHQTIMDFVESENFRFVLVIGGGAPARIYQQAYKDLLLRMHDDYGTSSQSEALDRIGIKATHLNAQLIKELFADSAVDIIVTNPESQDIAFTKPILIGAGWKPGFSTDLDAVVLAKRFEVQTVINLSNIPYIYTSDPKHDANAEIIHQISWNELIAMIGDEWKPGMHVPFDPVACELANTIDLQVITTAGRDLDNLRNILEQKEYYGTIISNG